MKQMRYFSLSLMAGLAIMMLFRVITADAENLPREVRNTLYYAQQAMAGDNLENAREVLNTYLTENPSEPYAEIFLLLGNTWFREDNMQHARDVYQQGIAVIPDSSALHLNYAVACYHTGDFELCGNHFIRAYELDAPSAKIPDIGLLYKAAAAFYQGENYVSAEKTLRRLMSLSDKPHMDWLELLVYAQINMKSWGAAEKTTREMIQIDPSVSDAWQLLAHIHLNQEQYRPAATALEIAYTIAPPEPSDWKNLADLYLYMNAPLKAADALEKSVADRPGAFHYEHLSEIYARALRFDEALRCINRALEIEVSADRYYKKGMYLYQMLNTADASSAFRNALEIDKKRYKASLMLGFCAIDLQQWEKAKQAFLDAARSDKYRSWAEGSLFIVEEMIAAKESTRALNLSMKPYGSE